MDGRFASRYFTTLLVIFLAFAAVQAQFDPGFGDDGVALRVTTDGQSAFRSFLLSDGKILLLVQSTQSNMRLKFVRFNADGSIDNTFGTNGEVGVYSQAFIPDNVDHAEIQPDGKLILVGSHANNTSGIVARFNTNGSLDTTFSGDGVDYPNIDPTFNFESIHRSFVLPDGKILLVGRTRSFNSEERKLYLMRYESNGTVDATFGDQAGHIVHALSAETIRGVGRQSTGKIVVAASFGSSGNFPRTAWRFNANGTLDNTFTAPVFPLLEAARMLVLSDDRILMGGTREFTDNTLRHTSDVVVTRLTADGARDATFGPDGTRTYDVAGNMKDVLTDWVQLPDGSVVMVAGVEILSNRTTYVGGYPVALKIGTAGSVLGRFIAAYAGRFASHANGTLIHLQPDGKILLVGGREGGFNHMDVQMSRLMGLPPGLYRFRGFQGFNTRSVFRASTNEWWIGGGRHPYPPPSVAGDIPVAASYIGDGLGSQPALYRPSNGTWYIDMTNEEVYEIRWGTAGDIPVPYDYEGDGKSDAAVFRPSDGHWYIRHGSDGSQRIQHWGTNGDKPVPGDYDGDGLGDLAVWRPSTGVWYIARSSDSGYTIATFGLNGDVPVADDFDGDLKTDIAVWRPSTGVWYIWRSSDSGFTILQFGLTGDVPLVGDWNGDKKVDIGAWRPGNPGTWYSYDLQTNTSSQFLWGAVGDYLPNGRY